MRLPTPDPSGALEPSGALQPGDEAFLTAPAPSVEPSLWSAPATSYHAPRGPTVLQDLDGASPLLRQGPYSPTAVEVIFLFICPIVLIALVCLGPWMRQQICGAPSMMQAKGRPLDLAVAHILAAFYHAWRPAVAVAISVGAFLSAYLSSQRLRDAINSFESLNHYSVMVLFGSLTGACGVLLPVAFCHDRGPWLSMSETWAVLMSASELRRTHDLKNALAWRVFWNVLIFGAYAALLKCFIDLLSRLGPLCLGHSSWSGDSQGQACQLDVGLYAARWLLVHLFFGPIVLCVPLMLSLMLVSNAGNFRPFLREQQILTWRSYLCVWGLPAVVVGWLTFGIIDLAVFMLPQNVQPIICLLFGLQVRVLENIISLARSDITAEDPECVDRVSADGWEAASKSDEGTRDATSTPAAAEATLSHLEEGSEKIGPASEQSVGAAGAASRLARAHGTVAGRLTRAGDTPIASPGSVVPEYMLPYEHLAILIERAALAKPSTVALRSLNDGETMSFGVLYSRACRLANALLDDGLGSEDLVGLMVARSAAAIVGMLGVVLAGGAYVPLDPSYPPERLSEMIEGARLHFIVVRADSQPAAWLLATKPNVTAVDPAPFTREPPPEEKAAEDPLTRAGLREKMGSNRLWCVLFTSGSTGAAKAVPCYERPVIEGMRFFTDIFPFAEDEAVLHHITCAHQLRPSNLIPYCSHDDCRAWHS